MKTRIILLIIFVCVFSMSAFAQGGLLKGSSGIEFYMGFWGGKASSTYTQTGLRSESVTSGFTGKMVYSYGLREHLALILSGGILGGEASTTTSGSEVKEHASTVLPVLIGLKFYVPDPEPEEVVRPFVSASVGPYLGLEASNTELGQEARSESVIGGRLAAGVDFLVGRHFKLAADVGYNLMADFEIPVGARRNYNGADFALGFGFIF